MNIRFLETAIWLAQLRNFRATADHLNITSAAISNRVAAMEQELGFKLFERDTRDVRLTTDGSTFVEGAQDIVARYKELVRSLDPTSGMKGSVRIGLPRAEVTGTATEALRRQDVGRQREMDVKNGRKLGEMTDASAKVRTRQ